ncbi:Panacea domain-containing protein [Bacillus seohaeanensis]|uniref:Panacea domain-containing protein n=1 Tax=Bacillus seohaeanensis TaxID=284580 RepID=A0ABW5RRU5_9BACI
MTMRQFADHVIAVSNKSANGISNLQLQKVMYFALGDYIKEYGIDSTVREIYTEPFQAWTYGPVVESEYHRYKKYGRFSIMDKGTYNDQYEIFNDYIVKYLGHSVNDLVEESHSHSTWYKNRQSILLQKNVEYRIQDLENDFVN